ncbi:MAG: hypothetical protein AB1730_12110 [Myxococcota bacterium]|jgi:hypothetical protein
MDDSGDAPRTEARRAAAPGLAWKGVLVAVVLGVGLPVLLLQGAFTCSGQSEPRGRLTAESRADAPCRADALGALALLRDSLGFAYEVTEADVEALREPGSLEKVYARDGTTYSVDVGVDVVGDGGCALRVWGMSASRPLSSETRIAPFATRPVPRCRCEAR